MWEDLVLLHLGMVGRFHVVGRHCSLVSGHGRQVSHLWKVL